MFNIFKKEVKEDTVELPKSIIVSDFKKEIITKDRKKVKVNLEDLFWITEDCKELINYDLLPDEAKYRIEKYQDTILYYAQNYKLK